MAVLYAVLFGVGDLLLATGVLLLVRVVRQQRVIMMTISHLRAEEHMGRVLPMQPMPRRASGVLKGQTAAEALAAIRAGQAHIRRAYGRKEGEQ